jgi:hypothetical protein
MTMKKAGGGWSEPPGQATPRAARLRPGLSLGDLSQIAYVARSAMAERVAIASACPRPPSAPSADAANAASSIVRFSSSWSSR